MDISSTTERSEVAVMHELNKLSDAGGSLIQIRTREPIRLATTLRSNFLISGDEVPYHEWDCVNGFRRFTRENYLKHVTKGDEKDFGAAIVLPLEELRKETSAVNTETDKVHYFAFVDPHPFIGENPFVIELLQQYAAILPTSNVCVLLITPDVPLRNLPVGTVLVADMHTPNADELEEALRRTVEDATAVTDGHTQFADGATLEDNDYRRIAYLGLGLTLNEFVTYASIAVIEAVNEGDASLTYERLSDGIAKGKTEVVRQSDILELIASGDMEDVGGMHRLKDWIKARANCFSDEAKAFGIEPPKGFAVVGVPGTGKSLLAKAVAAELGVPAVRLDFGRVFSKFVGDSESRVRSALSMIENMAPCVLFVDEIDKGLGGAGGSGGDAGTSSRVLGSFLTWLQENKQPVFTIVTANRTEGLPPELLRRGRFDAIFSVGLPTAEEREEVLAIHLRKRGHSITDLGDLTRFLAQSDGYVPAEIESGVRDALVAAFNLGGKLKTEHLLDALREMVPISKSRKADIDKMVDWAANNATPVNYPPGDRPGQAARTTRNVGGKQIVAPARRVGRVNRGR